MRVCLWTSVVLVGWRRGVLHVCVCVCVFALLPELYQLVPSLIVAAGFIAVPSGVCLVCIEMRLMRRRRMRERERVKLIF